MELDDGFDASNSKENIEFSRNPRKSTSVPTFRFGKFGELSSIHGWGRGEGRNAWMNTNLDSIRGNWKIFRDEILEFRPNSSCCRRNFHRKSGWVVSTIDIGTYVIRYRCRVRLRLWIYDVHKLINLWFHHFKIWNLDSILIIVWLTTAIYRKIVLNPYVNCKH